MYTIINKGNRNNTLVYIYLFIRWKKRVALWTCFPSKTIPEKISVAVPAECSIARSDSGSIMAKVSLNILPISYYREY